MRSLITSTQAWIIYAPGDEAIARNGNGGLITRILEYVCMVRRLYVESHEFYLFTDSISKPEYISITCSLWCVSLLFLQRNW